MTCDERRVVAFLNGEVGEAEEQTFDEHLLTCEQCWRAVQDDRASRLALERLRVPAPPGLADRVTGSVGLAARSQADVTARRPRAVGRSLASRIGRGRRGRMLLGAALGLAAMGALMGWVVTNRNGSDPPQIAGVVAMMASRTANSPALHSGEHLSIGGQPMRVKAYRIDGDTTLVATSDRPFPMPGNSHLVAGSSSNAWMATRGSFALYCVNRPVSGDRTSMFLVGDMPMARLPEVAARLHLI